MKDIQPDMFLRIRGMSRSKSQVDLVEEIIRGMVKGGIPIHEIAIGFHNALCHGELHEGDIDDDDLVIVIDRAEALSNILRQID